MATVEEMYRGIYGPAPAAKPQLSPDVYQGIYGPANYSNEPGTFPTYGALADMFPGSSQTKTQMVEPAMENGPGFMAGFFKAPEERLLPDVGIGQPPATRRVQSVQAPPGSLFGGVPPMPIARPGMGSLFGGPMPMDMSSSIMALRQSGPGGPLRVTVSGGAEGGGGAAEMARRGAAPAPAQGAMTPVQRLQSQGMSAAQAYDTANQQSKDRAHEAAVERGSISGGRTYDPDSGRFR